MYQLEINPGKLSLKQLREVSRQPVQLSLNEEALPGMLASAEAVAQIIKDDKVVYGINTGFGCTEPPMMVLR